MNFSLSDDQQALLRMVREFAEREVKPIAAEIDREARFPSELARRMAELGLMGVEVPVEWGGSGLDPLSYVLAMGGNCRGLCVDGGDHEREQLACVRPAGQVCQ